MSEACFSVKVLRMFHTWSGSHGGCLQQRCCKHSWNTVISFPVALQQNYLYRINLPLFEICTTSVSFIAQLMMVYMKNSSDLMIILRLLITTATYDGCMTPAKRSDATQFVKLHFLHLTGLVKQADVFSVNSMSSFKIHDRYCGFMCVRMWWSFSKIFLNMLTNYKNTLDFYFCEIILILHIFS